jgi:hypothetical protein
MGTVLVCWIVGTAAASAATLVSRSAPRSASGSDTAHNYDGTIDNSTGDARRRDSTNSTPRA